MDPNRMLLAAFLVVVAVIGAVFLMGRSSPEPSAAGASSSAQATRGSLGTTASDFSLATHDDYTLTLSKLRGKRGAVLVFFATWCAPCVAEVPLVKELVRRTREKSVLVYGVDLRQPKRVAVRFVEEHDLNYRVLLDTDGAVASAYGVGGVPMVIGIDAAGVIRYRDTKPPEDAESFAALLTAPLATSPETNTAASSDSAGTPVTP